MPPQNPRRKSHRIQFYLENRAIISLHCLAESSGGDLFSTARCLGGDGAFLSGLAVAPGWAIAFVFDEAEGGAAAVAGLAVEDVLEVSCCGCDAGAGEFFDIIGTYRDMLLALE